MIKISLKLGYIFDKLEQFIEKKAFGSARVFKFFLCFFSLSVLYIEKEKVSGTYKKICREESLRSFSDACEHTCW